MARGAWRATVHGVTKSQTRLNDNAFIPHPTQVIPVFLNFRTAALEQHLLTFNAQESLGHPEQMQIRIQEPGVGLKALNF